MNIIDKGVRRTGQTFSDEIRTVVVHDGARGPRGFDGEKGDQGDQGDSIVVKGPWSSGQTYCPLDAVRARSSLVDHVWSLYVQKSTIPCLPSTVSPHLDAGRWEEIGPYEWGNYLGGIWEVYQANHGFTRIGQPVAYSYQADRYILADARRGDEIAIGVVRDVLSADRVVLQSSGEVPNIDPAVIHPAGSDWEPGQVYYVSTVRGTVSRAAPTDANYFTVPILMPTDVYAPAGGLPSGGRNGVALPWAPAGGPGSTEMVLVGQTKYYYTITTDGQTVVSGLDDRGTPLAYLPGDNTTIYLNGVNLVEGQDYTADDSLSVVFTEPLSDGYVVEIVTALTPPHVLVPSTVQKVDNIETLFDGVTTVFPLQIAGVDVKVQTPLNTPVWLDSHPQEPLSDYTLIEDPAQPGSQIAVYQFTQPPPAGTRFWGTVFIPIDQTEPFDKWRNGVLASGVSGTFRTRKGERGSVDIDVNITKGGPLFTLEKIGDIIAEHVPVTAGGGYHPVWVGNTLNQGQGYTLLGIYADGSVVIEEGGQAEDVFGTGMWINDA